MDKDSLETLLGTPQAHETYTTLGTVFSSLGTANLIFGFTANPGFFIPMAGFYAAGIGCYAKGWYDRRKN